MAVIWNIIVYLSNVYVLIILILMEFNVLNVCILIILIKVIEVVDCVRIIWFMILRLECVGYVRWIRHCLWEINVWNVIIIRFGVWSKRNVYNVGVEWWSMW